MKKLSLLVSLATAITLASCAGTTTSPTASSNLILPGAGNTTTSTWSNSTTTTSKSASVESTLDLLSTTQSLLSGYKAIFGQDSVESLKAILPSKVGTSLGLLDKTSTYISSLTADELALFKQIISNSVSNEKLWALVTGAKNTASAVANTAPSNTANTSSNSFLTNAAALQLATNLLGSQQTQQAQNALSYYKPQAADQTQQTAYSTLSSALASLLGK